MTCGGCCPLLEELLDKAASRAAGDRSMAERAMAATAERR